MSRVIFVVEMLRNNTREQHSYVIGVYEDELEALKEAWAHMDLRASKYGAEITGHEINGGSIVYRRTLNQWDAFAQSCKDMAQKVQEMLDKEKE